ncbi:signal peptidase II [Phenylobacterium deserti]|uniref:Lipoprotein signal peptidase n=1 Tax=Phenylobacterium deserti TaxID=1914756 RepID=A0A328ATL2_9CAUL|nr:signal peptidase II [Phenylobacterium deserti]RAK57615.1 signal peptidase II [Phenylobacterium deserti]
MKGVTRHGVLAFVLAAVVLILDQVSKFWILEVIHLPERPSLPVAGPLQFSFVWNQGVSFGMLQGQHEAVRWALVIFSVVVAIVLSTWAARSDRRLSAWGLGLIIGGAIGNAIDRARFGAVVDFIDVQQIGFFPWIFNIADSGITVGVILLLIDSLRRERPA